MNDGIELINYLSSSKSRVQILNKLDSTEADLQDLIGNLNIPRSTLQRNLNTLVHRGWIKETQYGYETTPTGELLVQEFTATAEIAETIDNLSDFFQNVESWETIDLCAFNDPEVSVLEPGKPYWLVNELLKQLDSSSKICGFLSIMSPFLHKHLQYIHTNNNYEGSYIISTSCIDIDNYYDCENVEECVETLEQKKLEVLAFVNELPYSLLILDGEEVILTASDEFGRIEVLIKDNNPELIKWGKSTYMKYRKQYVQSSGHLG